MAWFGADQVCNDWSALEQVQNPRLDKPISFGHPFMLAQMLNPRLDQEGLQKSPNLLSSIGVGLTNVRYAPVATKFCTAAK